MTYLIWYWIAVVFTMSLLASYAAVRTGQFTGFLLGCMSVTSIYGASLVVKAYG